MKGKVFAAVVGLAALMLVGAACSNGGPSESPTANNNQVAAAQNNQNTQTTNGAISNNNPVVPTGAQAISSREVSPSGGVSPVVTGYPMYQASNSQSGIWVVGEGSISLEPDLVILNLGVETNAATVAEARDAAATAMEAIQAALTARGVEDKDIQTQYFNIYPQYEWIQTSDRNGKQVLVGYNVSHSVSVKIRDLDAVGNIIDEVSDAGGDATRINGINFTIENPKAYMNDLREMAVNDAKAKADHFAALTGVGLGPLVFISESSGSVPYVSQDAGRIAFAESAQSAPSTSISTGQLELRMTVQAVYGIGNSQ